VKLVMDHRKHVAQFPKIFADAAKANQVQAVSHCSKYVDSLLKSVRPMHRLLIKVKMLYLWAEPILRPGDTHTNCINHDVHTRLVATSSS